MENFSAFAARPTTSVVVALSHGCNVQIQCPWPVKVYIQAYTGTYIWDGIERLLSMEEPCAHPDPARLRVFVVMSRVRAHSVRP
jgi:hypothetical protein